MKNKIIILIAVLLILAAVVWLMKPDDSSPIASSSAVVDEFPLSTSTDSQSSSEALIVNETMSTQHEAENRQQNELIDTKSDLSIQPIDPETDPGNQIVKKN